MSAIAAQLCKHNLVTRVDHATQTKNCILRRVMIVSGCSIICIHISSYRQLHRMCWSEYITHMLTIVADVPARSFAAALSWTWIGFIHGFDLIGLGHVIVIV